MVPYSDFMSLTKTYGMSEITRHNLYNSSEVTGAQAPGYSSGQALRAIQEVAQRTLPKGYDYDWAGISKDEAEQGNTAIVIFVVVWSLFTSFWLLNMRISFSHCL